MTSRMLIEIASWRVAAELVRRRPAYLHIIETHPCSGQYDCLSIVDADDPAHPAHLIDLNRHGSAHVHRHPRARFPDFWDECGHVEDLRPLVDRLGQTAGLPAGDHLPPSTPRSLTYRFVAAFLAHAAFGRLAWTCRGAHDDGAWSPDDSVRRAWFAPFRAAAGRLAMTEPDDPYRWPAHRFWFLLRDGEPVVCLETTGRAWDRHGREHRLDELYHERRRLWPLITAVAGDLLP